MGTYSRWRGDFSRAALAQSCAGSEAAAKTRTKLRAAKNRVAGRLMLGSVERSGIGRQGDGALFYCGGAGGFAAPGSARMTRMASPCWTRWPGWGAWAVTMLFVYAATGAGCSGGAGFAGVAAG